jgi:hypothetical protein
MRVHTDTRYGRSSIHQATLLVFLVMGGLAGLATPAKADTIFTSIIGSGIGGPGVQGPSEPGGSESLAEAFTPAAEYELTDVQVEVFQVLGFGSDPYFNVSLFSNASGVPGSLIDTLGTDLTAPVGVGIVTVSGTALLNAGTEYWVVLTPFDSTTQIAWEDGASQSAPVAVTASTTALSGWSSSSGTVDPQLQVDGTPIPEPCSFALVCSGVIGVIGLARRRMA